MNASSSMVAGRPDHRCAIFMRSQHQGIIQIDFPPVILFTNKKNYTIFNLLKFNYPKLKKKIIFGANKSHPMIMDESDILHPIWKLKQPWCAAVWYR